MKDLDLTAMTDEQIVRHNTELLVRAGQQRTVNASNALLLEAKVFGDALVARGPETLRKLLPLLNHENCHVQVAAAVRCYKIGHEECSALLWEQAQAHSPASSGASLFLLGEDPAYREFLTKETDKSLGGTWWQERFSEWQPKK
ncbi:MAG TPA: hypothetical protein VK558_07350 [Patescibacteria group bacterium]|nr:hypothetical protein [Patescibacteria group bacterium]